MAPATEAFQIPLAAAEMYESKFVPALFAEWAPHLIEAAGVSAGDAVLDVACGTGVVAREAADRMNGKGQVVGLDINQAMLEVAGRLRPDIEWREGDAADLPFSNESFDVVLCQASMMFFPDRAQALREMARVAVADGTVAIQVWDSLDAQPAYGPFVDVAARHAGPEAIDLLSAYWVLGDIEVITALFEAAELQVISSRTRLGTARFDSVDELVRTEVESTPLIERISDEVYGKIREDTREVLGPFTRSSGEAEIPIQGHLITARKP